MDGRITKFNFIKGDVPQTDKEAFWKQVRAQAEIHLEEAQEMLDAAINEDLQELLDGSMDCWFVREYMDDILEANGIDVKLAKQMVCDNNLSKFTTNPTVVEQSVQKLINSGNPVNVGAVSYDGELFYALRRIPDGKVMKPITHVAPELDKCISEKVLERLCGN